MRRRLTVCNSGMRTRDRNGHAVFVRAATPRPRGTGRHFCQTLVLLLFILEFAAFGGYLYYICTGRVCQVFFSIFSIVLRKLLL